MTDLFQRYDRFLSTSRTSAAADRLHARWGAVVDAQRDLLEGARVLDVASHDGRWAFAALDAGAAHVTGVEPRAELVEAARQTFSEYAVAPERYDLVVGDIFDYLAPGSSRFDTVLCLGFYYHTARHVELFDLMDRTGAGAVVIDTEVVPPEVKPAPDDPRLIRNNPYEVQLLREPVDHESMAAGDATSRAGHTIVGRPSRAAVSFIADHFGFDCVEFDWPAHLAAMPGAQAVADYREGWRTTFRCTRRG